MYFNRKLSDEEIGRLLGRSARTIRRWRRELLGREGRTPPLPERKRERQRKYPPVMFERIVELKHEVPQRSGAGIWRLLCKECPRETPSESTVRKYLAARGLSSRRTTPRQGFKQFQREKPNDLWQIDIAGVQTFRHLGKLYLFALIDDSSRFVVAAHYFPDQTARNVFRLLRDAIVEYGRPNQILADNGSQFRNVHSELEGRYERFLHSIGVEPIFARTRHPQTKGKLERWFRTVIQMFALEARVYLEKHPDTTLVEFNSMFQEWVRWYNHEKPHRELPGRCPPSQVFEDPVGIHRPLETVVDWNRWIYEAETRTVKKTNLIAYQGKLYPVPPGHAKCKVEVRRLETVIEVYHEEGLLATHVLDPGDTIPGKSPQTRIIARSGTIGYGGSHYTVSYKLAGKTVEVRETRGGRTLLVYLDGILVKEIPLK